MRNFGKLILVCFFFIFFIVSNVGEVLSAGSSSCGGGCPNTQTCQVCDTTGGWVSWCCVRPGNNCAGTGYRLDCAPGTIRSNTVVDSQCARICAGMGTAQAAGDCCDWQEEEPSGCVESCVYNPRTGNNRCHTTCENPGGPWCRTSTTYTYSCTPVCTAPSTPTISTPDDGSSLTSTTVSLQWDAVTWGTGACTNQYKIYVGTTNPPTTLQATVDSNTTSTNFTGTRGTTYYWYVQATNGLSNVNSAVRSFTILNNQITGTIYLDTNNTCSTSVPWTTGGVSVSIDGGAGNVVNGSGVYSGTATVGLSHSAAVVMPSGYICSTGAGCNNCTASVVSPGIQNFYLTNVREAWWQTEGAGIYAGALGGGVTVRSEMPSSSYRLILAGGAGTPAALLRGSGSTDLGTGSVSDSLWTTVARYKGKRLDYQYFAAQMGVVPTQTNDWASDNLDAKPSTTKDFHYIGPQSGTATVSSPWVVPSGEKYVVFVNGDLRVAANTTVDNGGFLSFVVSGDIIVDPSVTTLQGIYLSTGNFETESVDQTDVIADVQLNVSGSVITWGTFSLGRSLIGSNITTPAEKFTYRPDLLANMPDKMKTFAYNWQEVAPGTFGE